MLKVEKTIFEYDNYREFLRDYYVAAKARDKKFSFRYFSRILGYSSPIFVKRVMDGARNLTEDGIQRFIKALKFNKEEAQFFKNLVALNQAKNNDQKILHARNLLRTRTYRRLSPLKEAQFSYYANWYLVPIRELVGLPSFKEDPQWISQRLVPSITPVQAKKALEELSRLGLIERDQQGNLRQTSKDVTSPDEVISAFKADWLMELIKMGAESIGRIPREKRDISSVTVGISAEGLKNIKELSKKFRADLLEIAARENNAESGEVYQFNIQLFPLTHSSLEEKK